MSQDHPRIHPVDDTHVDPTKIGPTGMSDVIDQILPTPQYREQHHLDLACDQQSAYQAARTLDFGGSRIVKTLFHLRGLHFTDLTIQAMTSGDSFRIVGECPPEEFVIGHISDGFQPVVLSTPDHFRAVEIDNGLKIAWNFRTAVLADGITRLSTETRVSCHGSVAACLFRPYWMVVRPFSGLIRREMLRAAATTNRIPTLPES